MKTPTAVILLLAVIAFVTPAPAGKPHRDAGNPQPNQQQHEPQLPSVQLARFTAAHLDRILSPIDRRVPLPRTRLSQLRASFANKWAQAPDREKAQYQTAVTVCDALNAAMDEREKALASLQGSAAVHGPSDLGAHRKDIPTHGTRADAQLAGLELQREAHEEQNRKQEAAQNDDFLTTALKTNWTQRALQLRQSINSLLTRQRDAERAAQQPAATDNAAPAANTITLDKPIQVKVKYGRATIPAGTTLSVVGHDANGVVVQYMGEDVVLPR
jgi:hypothetical protein